MAHELDQIAGHVSYADARRDAWHQLGQQVGHAMTAREALRAAHLADWNVRKLALVVPQEPIITEAGVTTPAPLPVPDQWATVRTNPINGQLDVLGVVGNKYEPMQNEASCDLLDALTGESGAVYETGRPTNPTRSDDVGFASGDVGARDPVDGERADEPTTPEGVPNTQPEDPRHALGSYPCVSSRPCSRRRRPPC